MILFLNLGGTLTYSDTLRHVSLNASSLLTSGTNRTATVRPQDPVYTHGCRTLRFYVIIADNGGGFGIGNSEGGEWVGSDEGSKGKKKTPQH